MRPLHFARELLLLAAAFLLHAGETFAGVILTPEQLEAQPHKPGVVRFGFLKPMKAYGDNNYQPGEADIRRPLIDAVDKIGNRIARRNGNQEVDVISLSGKIENPNLKSIQNAV